MLDSLSTRFPTFVLLLRNNDSAQLEEVLPPASDVQISRIEKNLGIPLPESYKEFLKVTRGFWLFGGAVQFGSQHPFLQKFPPLEKLAPVQRKIIQDRNEKWPPPSDGMLCFADYFKDADGDQVLFDISGGLKNGEYPVVYYSHGARPASIKKIAESFGAWLNEMCIQQMTA